MPRRSRNQITKELAKKIIDKLEAVKESSGAHDQYVVYHKGEAVAIFGLRHSSQKNKGHDHIPPELGVGPNFAKQLGQCTKSFADFLKKLGYKTDDDAAES